MNKKAYAFFLKKNRKRKKQNPIAADLSDGRYQQRVVKDKTKYSRKEKHGQTNRYNEDSNSA
jgi:stalled ribosome alternative rescue factor ArfA